MSDAPAKVVDGHFQQYFRHSSHQLRVRTVALSVCFDRREDDRRHGALVVPITDHSGVAILAVRCC